MGLERVEVENFKSYAGFHIIGPFDRFTCIVGPNGSGKSNIMDAVTFCLGIGSKHLRANNIRSLINGGSSHASVALHIEGSGERRVFKRRISSEGRSQYFVDSESVGYERFREVVEGMNLLVDARNFLVFQGDVNAIGNMMPMELTRVFEEASGSLKLKEAYEEKQRAQAKAVSECASLFEEKKEVMSRMKEAEEVREQEGEFRKLVERKHKVQRDIVLYELMEKRNKKKDISNEMLSLGQESRKMEELVCKKEKEVEKHRGRISEIRRRYFEADALVSKQKEVVAERRAWKSLGESERSKRRVRIAEIEMEIRAGQEMMGGKKREIERRRRDLAGVAEGYSELWREEEERKERLNGVKEKEEEIEKREKEFLRMCGEERERLNTLEMEEFPRQMMKDDCIRKIGNLKERSEELESMIKEKKMIRGNTGVKIDALERSSEELGRKILHHEEKYSRLISEEKEKNEELSWVLGEILRIKGKRRIDGRHSVIAGAVETLREMFPGVYGRVVDLIKPTRDKYEIALSVLLGGHDQSVVVDTEVTAMSCINFIKEKKLCKMTFVPLHSIRDQGDGRDVENAVEKYGEGVRRASDAVKYDGKYKKIVSFLFREKLIADSMEIAKDICYGRKIKVSVCTLDGIYIYGGGYLISGGGEGRNKFQEDELDELVKKRMRILDELRRIQDGKNELSHVEICRERMEVWKKSKELEMETLRELDSCIEDLELRIGENKRMLEETEECLKRTEEEMGQSEVYLKELRKKIEEVESSVFCGIFPNAYFGSFEEYKKARESEAFALKSMEYEGIKAKTELRIEMLEREVRDLEEETERLRREVEGLSKDPCRDEIDIDALDSELMILEEGRRKNLEAFKKARDEFKEINEEFKELVDRRNELDQQIIHSTSARERLEEEIKDTLSFAVLEEIDLPCAKRMSMGEISVDEIDFSGLEGSVSKLRKELEEINQKISSQAPVIRMEERDGDNARYMRISAEYEKRKAMAIAAKNEFNEVKKRRTHLFMECFEKVNKEISRIYKLLTMTETGEGNAYLVLENTAEPFREGIRFHLMPPNKRFREVRLLSGGEKTMAALSLLFSLHAYRPAPFYLFDEVDSALDKANVSKIVSFIVSCNAQFILITLKPSLFQHSDGLVGVYKDPREGVSKVLTYRLGD
ncbi:chromosome segregation ATPase [Encephalitozoon intestinalis ATCC 50506]|uniref:Chromosome segregation ATPase n=1 Tax=Encephalitozoon intestinalis (strain ATCC 50506) TaxID=876142 RepID=E0S6P4_ENCIT|nr:chromosome segregation ATPase [Encephalitozoon intestinalis ATCC 50506]ADM11379.1 chromosome segregation ATPase [Encephalitozoon intestinalis ATCC 50506]UTX45069.1 structural maintenance of chromosomes protein 1 [Encephalitozoon intestinalis]